MGQKPDCVLCPNKGGAMKSTKSGQKWAHVSCALWIPEVSIGSVDRMEPITKISSIPKSRWDLNCVLCRERVGACIQCSVKTCKTAYHVTCAFQHGLEMRAIIEDENAEDGVKLRSYCQKHSVKKEPKNSANAEKASAAAAAAASVASEDEEKSSKKRLRKEMTSEERNHARMARLEEIQSEFDKHVSIKDISCHLLDVDQEGINHIYNFWILKRKAGGNVPLLLPKAGDVDVMSQTDQEQADIEKMKMFVHLRQDLERVRNLCYMVSRREKLSRSFFKMREQIFHKQVTVLSRHKTAKLDDSVVNAIMEANHGPSIYDVLYSSDSIKETETIKIEEMIDSILGNTSSKSNKTLSEINGNSKKDRGDAASRYNKIFNGGNTANSTGSNKRYSSNMYNSFSSDTDGSARRRSRRKNTSSSASPSSTTTSDDDESPTRKSPVKPKPQLPPPPPQPIPTAQQIQPKKKGRPPGSTKQATAEKRKQLSAKENKTKLLPSIESSSEDDMKPKSRPKIKSPISARSRAGDEDEEERNMHLTDESDELVPIKNSSGHSIPTSSNVKRIQPSAIYSDSDSSSTDKDNKTDNTVSDSQQQPFRTKAAMKEFNINELPSFDKSKKPAEIPEAKKNSSQIKKPATPPSKKVTPPRRESKASPSKASRVSAKAASNLSSDSEKEEAKPVNNKEIVKEKTNSTNLKKEIPTDLLVVPQREAAKKASENLMKTNSSLMVQSITGTASEKNRRDAREKLDETFKSYQQPSESEREKDSKDIKSKSVVKAVKESKKPSPKEDTKKTQKETKDIEREKAREKDEKSHSELPSEFLPYVPQRQAAKKAAEHIKGLGNFSQPIASAVVEEKAKPAAIPAAKKATANERRKSTAVDLSSSSTSSASSDSDSGSSSDSESEAESPKQPMKSSPTKASTKSLPPRRASMAVSAKQKTKDPPFLDKAAKSSVNVQSSSSSSSDSDSSASDRLNTTRLSQKGNKNNRKPSVESSPTKKSVTASPSKKSATTTTIKKENDKLPSRRTSTVVKPQPPALSVAQSNANKTPTNRSPRKSVSEQTPPQTPSTSRKGSTSSISSQSKVSSSSKSRTSEPSKGDLAKLSDKRKSSVDIKEHEMNPPSAKVQPEPSNKKRKVSITSPAKEIDKEQASDKKSVESEKEKDIKETTVRRSSRSESISSKAKLEKTAAATATALPSVKSPSKSPVIEKDEKIEKLKEVETVADEPIKEIIKPPEVIEVSKEKSGTSKSPEVIEIMDESETDLPKLEKLAEVADKTADKNVDTKKPSTDDISIVNMDIDETITQIKTITENKPFDIKDNPLKLTPNQIPLSSPMVSIPTVNLTNIKEKELLDDAFNKVLNDESNLFSTANSIFPIPKIADKEDTERETLNLIEKLRQKNKKTNSTSNAIHAPDNNNVVNDKPVENTSKLSPCLRKNENTPKHDFMEQQTPLIPFKQQPLDTPSILSKKDQEFNDLKKMSPWHQQQLQQQPQNIDNNAGYQRNILTTNNNKINSTMDQLPAPASCMVVEQQQKQQQQQQQLAACQKIGEENNMLASNRGSMFMSPTMGMLMNPNEQPNHMEMFNMQMQQQQQQQQLNQKWPKDQKSPSLKMMHGPMTAADNMMKRNQQPGMENINMMNDMNQQAMKNSFQQHLQQKGPMTNDFSSGIHPHAMQGNFNSYNFSDNASQYPGAVSLFPSTDMNVQVPFPSPGQAMYPPNLGNNFNTATPYQNTDHSMLMQGGLHNKINNTDMMPNNIHFGAQNLCGGPLFQQQHMQQTIMTNNIHTKQEPLLPMMQKIPQTPSECSNVEQNVSEKQQSIKKSPSKSTRSSPRNSTPTHHGGKTPQKSPSKSPRQPSTPANIELLTRQNSKEKSTPTRNEPKQRKSRTNSQASPASTPAHVKSRNRNKIAKARHSQNAMSFTPFGNEAEYIAINQKLAGTVYDFSADDEFGTPGPSVENLRAMRDSRKSVDLYNKIAKDGSSQSPKTTKASLKSITHSSLTINNHTLSNNIVSDNATLPGATSISEMNLVNMPGPVDMRTYNSYDNTNDSYNSQLLGAFATNTVDQTLNEIDEEQEKELQTALKASNDKQKTPTTSTIVTSIETKLTCEITNIVEESVDSDTSFAKVSLSDSRNQLKLKIKGPLAHPDMHPQTIVNPVIPQIVASASSGSSNRRQMRKKELLQQYWNQGANMDQEPSNIQHVDHQTTSNIQSSRVGGIPKAVDSMGLGLLKDEFPDFNYAEYKKRKRFALRGSDPYSMDLDLNTSNNNDNVNASNESDPLTMETNKKRRNRPNRGAQLQQNTINPPPKLKIKIGSDIMETSGSSDLPPKKRHIAPTPSYQDLKRESMNFRKQMMEEFSEQKSKDTKHRTKEEKRERKEKKKKKKEKKRSVEIVSRPTTEGAPVKLILKIGNKSASTISPQINVSSNISVNDKSIELNTSAPPIKLKIARHSQGNGHSYNILNTNQNSSTNEPKSIHQKSNESLNKSSLSPTVITSTPISSNINNNNLQSSGVDMNAITKKLEVSLERIDDIEKAKTAITSKKSIDPAIQATNEKAPAVTTAPASKDCEVR